MNELNYQIDSVPLRSGNPVQETQPERGMFSNLKTTNKSFDRGT